MWSWTSFLLLVELLVFHIAFHICKAKVHGALYLLCLFFVILIIQMFFVDFCLVSNHGISPSMHALFSRSSKGRCNSRTSLVFICELLLFLLLQGNAAIPCYFFLFYVIFILLHWFGFFWLSPVSNHGLGRRICVFFYFFLECFCTYNSCWSSLNNYPELLYDNRF